VHFELWLTEKDYFEGKNLKFMVDFIGSKHKELISLAKAREYIKKS